MPSEDSPYAELATPQGRALLDGLRRFSEARVTDAAAFARSHASAPVAAAALATAFARKRAASSRKFESPESMIFTRESYEQATPENVAAHRARRFAGIARVADLCCGAGSDAIALARAGCSVTAVDCDADALACARANADALGVGDRVRTVRADAAAFDLSGYDAVFADPSRRSDGKRATGAAEYSPPLAALLCRAGELPGKRLAVKVAPGLRFGDRRRLGPIDGLALEIELVSDNGACKEAVLWCGDLARYDGARRASVIRDGVVSSIDAGGDPPSVARDFRAFIGEPDPAVIRAGLIGEVCALERAAVLDSRVAYITADAPARTPFARWFPLSEAMPFNAKRVKARLRQLDVRSLTVKTRAFPLLPAEIRRLLDIAEGDAAVLICATVGEKKWALLCGSAGP